LQGVDQGVDPRVKTGKGDPFIFVNKRLFFRKKERVPVDNVCPGSYLVSTKLFKD